MVSTHLKNISQNGNLPQAGMKIKNIWNHHLVMIDIMNSSPTYWFWRRKVTQWTAVSITNHFQAPKTTLFSFQRCSVGNYIYILQNQHILHTVAQAHSSGPWKSRCLNTCIPRTKTDSTVNHNLLTRETSIVHGHVKSTKFKELDG